MAVLVFPEILKAGFVWGGQRGEGALISHGHTVGYYKTVAASYGLQAGLQKFEYALFFMYNGAAGRLGLGQALLSSIQEWPSR